MLFPPFVAFVAFVALVSHHEISRYRREDCHIMNRQRIDNTASTNSAIDLISTTNAQINKEEVLSLHFLRLLMLRRAAHGILR